ncbi:tripartite tricarboxylate transporter TctB family protein [Paenibacillus sp. SC116]|uniref:tripartite tricarboxylate transporter TctB family protein n=1 Tax=Paenibacillus sp. SC116 TaxID=2968986 RepID=UPI00215A2D2A|nr:tripartite tricarboxylate transporter TctB family protein [Paenibacillus sp. SC116]MCR8843709.1 tripartite tricarboxylate transporter TctB family protein [Paenibacillus sp. SC116]
MMKRFDTWAGLVFLLIGIAFVVGSTKLSTSAFGSNVGPDIFPMALGSIMILLSARLMFETFKAPVAPKQQAHVESAATVEEDEATIPSKPNYKGFFLIFGAAFLYAFFLEDIGYPIGTFLFLLFAFQVMERGKWLVSTIIAAGFSLGIYYLFVKILQGTLPGFPSFIPL